MILQVVIVPVENSLITIASRKSKRNIFFKLHLQLRHLLICLEFNFYKFRAGSSITHKRITEPNFTIFELFSEIPFLQLPNRLLLKWISLGNKCELWIAQSMDLRYRIVLGIIFSNVGNCFGIYSVIFLGVMVTSCLATSFFPYRVREPRRHGKSPKIGENYRIALSDHPAKIREKSLKNYNSIYIVGVILKMFSNFSLTLVGWPERAIL